MQSNGMWGLCLVAGLAASTAYAQGVRTPLATEPDASDLSPGPL